MKKVACILLLISLAAVFGFQSFAEGESVQYEENEADYYDESYDIGGYIEEEIETVSLRGRVIRATQVESTETEYSGGILTTKTQTLEVKITEGKFKNKIVKAEHTVSNAFDEKYQGISIRRGDDVLLYIEMDNEGTIQNTYVLEVIRDKFLLYLVICFILLLIIVGKLKGLKAVVALIITCFAVIKILLPMILKGYNPVVSSVLVCTGIIAVTLIIVSGINKKTLAAIIGTAGGVMAAGIIAYMTGTAARLTGLGSEEARMLMYIPQRINFDFRGLLFAGIIIGALGAAMDVGMSIASAMYEIKKTNPDIKKKALIKAGMNVGRDIMGTMSNTLILAYAGGSLQLMLLLMAYEIPLKEIINRDVIASEVVRSLAGSIGLIFTIPLTAITAGFLSDTKSRYIKEKHINLTQK